MAGSGCGDDGNSLDFPDARPIPDEDGDTTPPADAGPDGGDTTPDAGTDAPTGGGAATSAQIQAVRDATDGAVDLPIDLAFVTYTKEAFGGDPAGFYVQAEQTGPALFVAVDPSSLDPVPAAGDLVSFDVTNKSTFGSIPQADAIANLAVSSSGNDVSHLIQDISEATDVVSAIGDYEAELITVTGTITSDFGGGVGRGFDAANVETEGVAGAGDSFLLRMPFELVDQIEARRGCNFTLNGTPVGRFNDTAQLGAWVAADITLSDCPGPRVLGAVATAADTVEITFDRNIDPASISAQAFTISPTLQVMAAAAGETPRVVVLMTTAQDEATTYTVTVDATVTDERGIGVVDGENTATFAGFVAVAQVLITEVNANIPGQCDMIELMVTGGGDMDGLHVFDRTSDVFTFPTMTVSSGDLIIIHFDEGACNVNNVDDEFTDKAGSSDPRNFDTAFDIWVSDQGLANTTGVIYVEDRLGDIQDAVFLSSADTGCNPAEITETSAAIVADAGQWVDDTGAVPSSGFVDEAFCANAALDLDATGTDQTGDTIQRKGTTVLPNDSTNSKADWEQTAQTWGVPDITP